MEDVAVGDGAPHPRHVGGLKEGRAAVLGREGQHSRRHRLAEDGAVSGDRIAVGIEDERDQPEFVLLPARVRREHPVAQAVTPDMPALHVLPERHYPFDCGEAVDHYCDPTIAASIKSSVASSLKPVTCPPPPPSPISAIIESSASETMSPIASMVAFVMPG